MEARTRILARVQRALKERPKALLPEHPHTPLHEDPVDLLLRRLQENGAEATRLPREEAKAFAQRLAEGLPLLRGRVLAWEPPWLVLEGGGRVRGEVLVYAGGGRGAHLLGLEGRHVPGLVLTLLDYFPRAVSYRVYLAGAALGGSYLPGEEGYRLPPPTEGEVEWLLQGAEALVGYRPRVASLWRGVRFRLSSFLFPVEGGFALTGLGSTGFLYAPLLAERLAERL